MAEMIVRTVILSAILLGGAATVHASEPSEGDACWGPSDKAAAYGDVTYAEATVQANCTGEGYLYGVFYGHFAKKTDPNWYSWQVRQYDDGCVICYRQASSTTYTLVGSAFDHTEMCCTDAYARASISAPQNPPPNAA